jgi:RNA polymerase sigma-70 factor (ECF subfamily)
LTNYGKLNSNELIAECIASSTPAAWQEFVRRFQPLIAGVVARTANRWQPASPALVDDLVQETYLKLCTEEFRRLREFKSRHNDAIYGFLKAVAYNVTLDYFKVRNAVKRGAKLMNNTDFDTSLKVAGQESPAEHKVLLQEIEAMIGEIAEKERDKVVFLLYYKQGFTAKTIAEIPSIELTEKGVESCLHRLTERLRKRVAGQAL